MIVLRRLQEQQPIQILVEEVAGGSHSHLQEQTEDGLSNCALCSGCYTLLYEPQTWRNEQAQQIAKSLHIWPDKRICRLCEDDITRLVKNHSHIPRWGGKCGVKCCMPGCDAPSFTQSKPSLWLPAAITFSFLAELVKPPS